jgi:hypothetical protein
VGLHPQAVKSLCEQHLRKFCFEGLQQQHRHVLQTGGRCEAAPAQQLGYKLLAQHDWRLGLEVGLCDEPNFEGDKLGALVIIGFA